MLTKLLLVKLLASVSEFERWQVLKIVNEPDYANLSPSKIVPKLADTGHYIASKSTLYRILKEDKQTEISAKIKTRTAS